ncbi:MAG: Ig-like domain-containing protein, partial [Flavobacteriaceae bacterium]
MNRILTLTCLSLFYFTNLFSQSNCTPIPEVNFPGGRVIMSFDGNVHDDDDILALPYATGLWWAAGLKDKVVQVEYNNHVCLINNNETDGSGPGSGDDSQNMRNSAAGAISRFDYNPNIFYDYETQGNASTSKMSSEIEKSTASNPLWIIAGGPMETVWRGLEGATKGHDHVTVISHSAWNEAHLHCGDDHNWTDLKNTYQNRGVFFVGFCSGSGCSQPSGLNDQNGGFSSAVSNWSWMQNSSKEYNRWIFGRNPFGNNKFDPSDAGMSYYLITGGPFNGGEKKPDHNDARKLMENPCEDNVPPVENIPPSLTITAPVSGSVVSVGSTTTISLSATDEDGFISKHQIFVNGTLVDTDGGNYTPYKMSNIAAGTHTIKATVMDNTGATTSKTVSITAGSSPTTPPPPPPPTTGGDPSVTITSPSDGQNFDPGNTVVVTLDANDPDGSIIKHQVYVDNKLVDTDGSKYTPHKINAISQGSHTIKVVVTDNDGNTASSSVTIDAQAGTSPGENENEAPDPPSTGSAPTVIFNTPIDNQEVATGSTVSV